MKDDSPARGRQPPTRFATRTNKGRHDLRRDSQVIQRLLDAVAAGASYEDAAIMAGIGARTFWRWKAQGLAGEEGSLAWQFWQSVRSAEAKAAHRNVMAVQIAAQKNWRAAAWWLERRFPEDWGRHRCYRTETSESPESIISAQPKLTHTNAVTADSEEERRNTVRRTFEQVWGKPYEEIFGSRRVPR